MIKFKIISGYYKDITYESEKDYDFVNLKKYDLEIYKAEDNYLESKITNMFRAKHIGLSLIDGCPIFIITKILNRYSIIKSILKK